MKAISENGQLMFQNAPHNYFQCDTCIIKVTCTQPGNIFFSIMKMISGEIINTLNMEHN